MGAILISPIDFSTITLQRCCCYLKLKIVENHFKMNVVSIIVFPLFILILHCFIMGHDFRAASRGTKVVAKLQPFRWPTSLLLCHAHRGAPGLLQDMLGRVASLTNVPAVSNVHSEVAEVFAFALG